MGRAAEYVPVTEARDRLKELLDRVADRNVVLVRRSRPVAVMVAPDRYQGLVDRIENLEDELSVLHARLHPGGTVPLEKVKANLGLMT